VRPLLLLRRAPAEIVALENKGWCSEALLARMTWQSGARLGRRKLMETTASSLDELIQQDRRNLTSTLLIGVALNLIWSKTRSLALRDIPG